MSRVQRRVALVLVLGLLGAAVWAYFHRPGIRALEAAEIVAVDVRFKPWGEDGAVAPGASASDPEVVAALVAVLRSGEGTWDHKCSSRGSITLRRSFGAPAELEFLPGHHAAWYELRYASGVYRVPRAAFVEVMRRLGVEVPLEC